jgi:hypothetical protein
VPVEPLNEALLVGLIVILVPVCGDVILTTIWDIVDGIVALFAVRLIIVSLVPVCDNEDVPILAVCDVSVCNNNWLDNVTDEVDAAVLVYTVELPAV